MASHRWDWEARKEPRGLTAWMPSTEASAEGGLNVPLPSSSAVVSQVNLNPPREP